MRTISATVLLLGLIGSAACGSSPTNPSAPTASGLPGTWQATRAEYVAGSVRVDRVSQGTTMVLTLNAGGSYVLKATAPGKPDDTTDGSWTASSDLLTLRPTGMSWSIEFEMTVNTTTLTLNGGHVAYDINGDGVDEECVLNATWARR
jgi:hypothetical protein